MSHPHIVVGVDGSHDSAHALTWAAEQAQRAGATLRVVYAWEPPAVAGLHIPPLVDWEPMEGQAREFVHHQADHVVRVRLGLNASQVPRPARWP